jgi:hypothetical protein
MLSLLYAVGICCIVLVMFVSAAVHSVKSGTFHWERKRLGAMFYIGILSNVS